MMCLRCFALMCKLKQDFDFNSSFLQRLPSRTEICLDLTANALQYIDIGYISQNEHFSHK